MDILKDFSWFELGLFTLLTLDIVACVENDNKFGLLLNVEII